jgi:uncharacterized protein
VTIPEFPDVRPLDPQDHGWISGRLDHEASPICDLSPANLFIWRDCERPSITMAADSLCILMEPHSEPAYFLQPVDGTRKIEAVRACLRRTGRISRAGKTLTGLLPAEEFQVLPLRDHFDYVFRTQDLAELKGKRFDGKRNHIRKFVSAFPDFEFRPLEPALFGDAAVLFENWTQRRGGEHGHAGPASFSHECQRRALDQAFRDFERLRLSAGAMFVRGEIQGFVIASITRGESAVVHFQYANKELPGIYQMLLHEACLRLFPHCPYTNLEEDLGVPGLRKTKMSYHPLHLEEKFEVRPV